MKTKFSKKKLIMTFEEKIKTEWINLTYDEIRKKIFELTQFDLENADIARVCRTMAIDRKNVMIAQIKKAKINFNPWVKYK